MDLFDAEDAIYSFPFDDTLINENSLHLHSSATLLDDVDIFSNNLNELEDMMNTESSPKNCPDKSLDILELSLDIPLTAADETQQANFFDLIPNDIPEDKMILVKIPEDMQNNSLFNEIMNIDLNVSLLEKINKSIVGHDGVFLENKQEIREESESLIVRRPPLQVIQQVIQYPAVKSIKDNANQVLIGSKRKQLFYPREDCVEFLSDDDENISNQEKIQSTSSNAKRISTIVRPRDNDNITPHSPKRVKIESTGVQIIEILEEIEVMPVEKITMKSGPQKCPCCEKVFKKIFLHKCKKSNEVPNLIPKLLPSEVPIPEKCKTCNKFFGKPKEFELHISEKHSHLVCKLCKHVSKNAQAKKVHMLKCGVNVEAVKKTITRSSMKRKELA